jgi:hypothetical protein
MLNKIKLISEEIEICQIDCTIFKKRTKKTRQMGWVLLEVSHSKKNEHTSCANNVIERTTLQLGQG